ncbi:MAG: hypothetical protein H6898_09790 [Rhodobacter sp.]|nr:hypothetical protein [Rhodobacter sp.]
MQGNVEVKIENQVLFGENGDLFLVGGGHSILRFMQGADLPARTAQMLHDNLVRRKAISEHYGAQFLHLIAPEKYVVYPENLPIDNPGHMARSYLTAGFGDAIYPVDVLRNPRRGRSYPLTDTHWSPHGILAIVEDLALRCGIEVERIAQVAAAVSDEIFEDGAVFYGDLGRKLDPKQGDPQLKFGTPFHCTTFDNGLGHDFNSPFNDGRLIVVDAQQACSDKTLLIFGDSYLYHALQLLALFFRRIVFMRTRFYHEEMVQMVQPDVVVSQMAERYMGSIAPDEVAPPFFMIPYLLGRPPNMSPQAAMALTHALCGRRSFDPTVFRLAPAGGPAEAPAPAAGSTPTPETAATVSDQG